jgi:seryl-tRNA synthetase
MESDYSHAGHSDLRSTEDEIYGPYRTELIEAGHLIPMGVPGLYARGGELAIVIERIDHMVTAASREFDFEIMRFPPVFARGHYEQLSHIRNFPDLMGSVHTFTGAERQHRELLETFDRKEDWTRELRPAAVMLIPAGCYPLYPIVAGSTLTAGGRRFDTEGFVFRHEPSEDPARMQIFRMREYVRLGTPEQALEHRDYWLEKGPEMFALVGLKVKKVVASDPFFGRGGKLQKAMQVEQALKHELVYPICSIEKPTAISSCNYHVDTFGVEFGIKTAGGTPAHSACAAFGLERIALALFKTHGLRLDGWPR